MRVLLPCLLLLVTGCELVVGDENRVVEPGPDSNDGTDGAAEAPVDDAGTPPADAAPPEDVSAKDSGPPPALEAGCPQPPTTCDERASGCAAACEATSMTCKTACMAGGPGSPPGKCMMQCAATDTTCKLGCAGACDMCLSTAPCPQMNGCMMATM